MTQRLDYLALCLAVAGAAMPAALAQHGPGKPETVLYVWASDQAHRAPDFLAVVDFDQDSGTYGRVLEHDVERARTELRCKRRTVVRFRE